MALERIALCDPKEIPDLFNAFPDEVKKDAAVRSSCIEKCHGSFISHLFAKFPDEIKQDAAVRISCVEKCPHECIFELFAWESIALCYPEEIPELFDKFPDAVKKDAAFRTSCIEKCDLEEIPKLFNAFPDEVKKDAAFCTSCIEKCPWCYIAELFAKFPEEIKQDAAVRTSCIEKVDMFMPQLFAEFPDEIKKDAAVRTSCFEKCSDNCIPELFAEFPEEIKQDAAVCTSCIEKCSDWRNDKLYAEFPDEIKKDTAIRTSCIEKCKDNYIPELFAEFPDEIKQDAAVRTSCIEKCSDDYIQKLFAEFPEEIKQDAAVRTSCLEKCHNEYIRGLFERFPEEIKQNAAVCTSCIEKCSDSCIPELFAEFPDEIKQDAAVRTSCIEKCHNKCIPELFAEFPEEIKQDAAVRTSCFESCIDYCIPELFAEFPDEIKQHAAVRTSCLEKCHNKRIPELFAEFPEEIKQDVAFCTSCIEKSAFSKLDELMEKLPVSMKNVQAIKDATDTKRGSGGLGQKHHTLLTTTPRLACSMLIFGGVVEVLVWIADNFLGAEALNVHWSQDSKKVWVFLPLSSCPLSPPQPLYLAAIYNAVKAMIFTLMFGYISRHLKQEQCRKSCKKRLLFVIAAILQLGIVPINTALTIWSFYTKIYPNTPDFRTAYECFYLRWGSSFSDFGYWLLFVRAFGVEVVLTASNMVRAYRRISTYALFRPSKQSADIYDALLGKDQDIEPEFFWEREECEREGIIPASNDIGALEWKKWVVTKNAMAIGASIYIIIDLPFLLSHKIPAGLAFSPVLLTLAAFILASFRFTWPAGWDASVWWAKEGETSLLFRNMWRSVFGEAHDSIGNGESPKSHDSNEISVPGFVQLWEQAERTGFLVVFPILFGMAILNLIMTYGSVYLYHGLGYFKSITLVIAERHFDRYRDNFYSQVLTKYDALSALINEVS